MATPQFLCANWDPDNTHCQKVGKYGCQNCRLVLVSTEERTQHMGSHTRELVLTGVILNCS